MRHLIVAGLLCATSSAALAEGSWRKVDSGVIVNPDRGSAKAVRLQVYGDQIVRVSQVPGRELDLPVRAVIQPKKKPGEATPPSVPEAPTE